MAEQPVDFQGSAGLVTGQSSGTMFPVTCALKSTRLLAIYDSKTSRSQFITRIDLQNIMPPIIFIVPGLWEGPQAFKPLQQTLEASGLTVHICALPSTGTTASQGLTVKHDRAAITQDLARVVERAGNDGVVVFLHSAGGFLCCDAMKDLTANAFDAANKKGGVRLIVFMSCALGVEGFETKPTSTMVFSVSVPGLHGTIWSRS